MCTFIDPRVGGVGGTSRLCGCADGYFGTGVECAANQAQEKRYYQEVYDRNETFVWPESTPAPCGCQKLEMNPCWATETWGPGGPDPCAQPIDYLTVTNLTCHPVADTSVSACTATLGGAGSTELTLPEGAKCCCQTGFVIKELDDGAHICEDPTPPKMVLNGPEVITITECQQFSDPSVAINDDNNELYHRRLITSYDPPLRESCVTPGTYNATYELVFHNAPPNNTRLIVVEPVDSCSIRLFAPNGSIAQSSDFINPKSCPTCGTNLCVEDATCHSDGHSLYSCICPPDMRGDGMWPRPDAKTTVGLRGFDAWWDANLPETYAGGTGCVDAEPPALTLLGPSRVEIPLCSCVGCSGDAATGGGCQRGSAEYIAEVKKALAAGKFCDEGPPCLKVSDNRDPNVSLALVTVDEPRAILEEDTGLTVWSVRYSVADRSGNLAEEMRVFRFREASLDEHLRHMGIGAYCDSNTGEHERLATRIANLQAAHHQAALEAETASTRVASLEADKADLTRRLKPEGIAASGATNCGEAAKLLTADNEQLRAQLDAAQRELGRLRAALKNRPNGNGDGGAATTTEAGGRVTNTARREGPSPAQTQAGSDSYGSGWTFAVGALVLGAVAFFTAMSGGSR